MTCSNLAHLKNLQVFFKLCCLCSGKKKPHTTTPQSFYTRFQKALHAVQLLDCHYEKELDDDKTKIIFFYSFPKEHIQG